MERQTTIETTSVSPWLREKLEMSQYEIHTRFTALPAPLRHDGYGIRSACCDGGSL